MSSLTSVPYDRGVSATRSTSFNRVLRSTQLTVDLGGIVGNFGLISEHVGPQVEVAAMVKADGYGLGAAEVGAILEQAGCGTFFVAHVDEGIALRRALVANDPTSRATVFVLSGAHPGIEQDLLEHHLRPVLNSLDQIERWARHGRGLGVALPAALHVDTGMNRLGLALEEVERLVTEPLRLQGVDVQILMSHLASADEPQSPQNEQQLIRFGLAASRLAFERRSLANSSGIFLGDRFHFDVVRPGFCLYGGNPTPGDPNPMAPVVTLEAPILQIRWIEAGETVGYGATFRAIDRRRIATLNVGYADGFHRALSGRGQACIGERPVPLVGRVSMDLVTVDVTDVPESDLWIGAPVELIGSHLSVDEVASAAGTIGYEVLTDLGRRYERRYLTGPEETQP